MAPNKILCVAEKPSIAKSVAQHLAGGNINTVGQVSSNLQQTLTLRREVSLAINMSRITSSTSILARHGDLAQ